MCLSVYASKLQLNDKSFSVVFGSTVWLLCVSSG